MRDTAYVALGSNLGDRDRELSRARAALADLPDSRIVGESVVEETAPLAGMQQPPYLNQMIALETDLGPRELLAKLHAIEQRAGRVRADRWAPRTLDLDIVCYERQTADDDDLRVPHPELPNRDFWLRELQALRGHPWE